MSSDRHEYMEEQYQRYSSGESDWRVILIHQDPYTIAIASTDDRSAVGVANRMVGIDEPDVERATKVAIKRAMKNHYQGPYFNLGVELPEFHASTRFDSPERILEGDGLVWPGCFKCTVGHVIRSKSTSSPIVVYECGDGEQHVDFESALLGKAFIEVVRPDDDRKGFFLSK